MELILYYMGPRTETYNYNDQAPHLTKHVNVFLAHNVKQKSSVNKRLVKNVIEPPPHSM